MTPSLNPDYPFMYAPDSTIWRINREHILLLMGARVLLMQIAHPMVAESVYHHSYVFQKPLLRLRRTLRLTLTMVYGTRDEVQEAIAEIERAHRPATGRIETATGQHEAGAVYNPRNPRQALWVFATLVEGAIFAYDRLVAPIDSQTQEAFYRDSMTFAQQMGISPNYLPESYAALMLYMQEAIENQEVCVGAKAREIAPFITGQPIPLVKYAAYPLFRFSVGMLPESLRSQYGYTQYNWETGLTDRFCQACRTVNALLPGFIRYVPPYRRAQQFLTRL